MCNPIGHFSHNHQMQPPDDGRYLTLWQRHSIAKHGMAITEKVANMAEGDDTDKVARIRLTKY